MFAPHRLAGTFFAIVLFMFSMGFISTPSPMQSRPDVLVVEDERISRRALASLLIASGYRTEAVGSAEEALDSVREGDTPTIALVDFNLPGMNGLELISRLEQMNPYIFPVLITAQSREGLGAGLRDGRVIYVQKPIDFTQLLRVLDERNLRDDLA